MGKVEVRIISSYACPLISPTYNYIIAYPPPPEPFTKFPLHDYIIAYPALPPPPGTLSKLLNLFKAPSKAAGADPDAAAMYSVIVEARAGGIGTVFLQNFGMVS